MLDATSWRRLDMLSVIGADTQLKRVARNDGGEYAGPCPFCGGSDRFHVWPDHPEGPRWRCFGSKAGRNGCGRGGDMLAYLVDRGDVTPQEAGRLRGNGGEATVIQQQASRSTLDQSAPVAPQAPGAPPAVWREKARLFRGYCQEQLHGPAGRAALDYLHGRGLTDDTIRRWGLGWHEKARERTARSWGLTGKPVWLLRGVTIPWTVEGEAWHVKIRRFNDAGPMDKPGKKYARITGGAPTLYGLDFIAGKRVVVICEGELDAVLLWQEAGDLVDVVAIGTKGAKVALPVLTYLVGASHWLVALDNDAEREAGDWGRFSARVHRVRPPKGNDLTDFHQAGGDLRGWVTEHLIELGAELGSKGSDELHMEAERLLTRCDGSPSWEEEWKEMEARLSAAQGQASRYPVTLVFPPDASVSVVGGQWKRLATGEIQATFNSRQELALCLAAVGVKQ